MCIKILLVMLLGVVSFDGTIYAVPASSSEFIVTPKPEKKKKLSSNALKESIGSTTKQTFESSTIFSQRLGSIQCLLSSLQQDQEEQEKKILDLLLKGSSRCHQSLGVIQQALAQVQNSCSSIAEKLLDNEKPFKKASKKALEGSLVVLSSSQIKLADGALALENLHKILSQKSAKQVIKNIEKTEKVAILLQEQEKMVQEIRQLFSNDECLKNL